MPAIEFIASLTRINIDGDGETKLTLTLPESELPEAVKMTGMKGTAFMVSISSTQALQQHDGE